MTHMDQPTSIYNEVDRYNHMISCLCLAATSNDLGEVVKQLGVRRKSASSVHSQLIEKEGLCVRKFDEYFRGKNQLPPGASIDSLLKALLMCPTLYTIPWEAAHSAVAHFHHGRKSLPREDQLSMTSSCILEVQTFLQQTVGVWLEQERNQMLPSSEARVSTTRGESVGAFSSPWHWIVRLVVASIEPFKKPCDEEPTVKINQQNWVEFDPLLDLVITIVNLAQDLDDTIYMAVLDAVFVPVKRSQLVPFLRLAAELRPYIRPQDVLCLHGMLESHLATSGIWLRPGSLLWMLKFLLTTVVDDANRSGLKWDLLLFQGLAIASQQATTFTAFEEHLYRYVSCLPLARQRRLFSVLGSTQTDCPRWLKTSLMLQVAHAASNSGSLLVSRMLERVSKQTRHAGELPHFDMKALCVRELDHVMIPSSSQLVEKGYESLQDEFLKTSYKGRGTFDYSLCHGSSVKELGCLLWDSLSIGGGCSRVEMDSYRVQSWIEIAKYILVTAEMTNIHKAVAILVTVHAEIKESWGNLIDFVSRGMFTNLRNKSLDSKTAGLVVGSIFSVICEAESKGKSKCLGATHQLQRIKSVLTTAIPLRLYTKITRSMAKERHGCGILVSLFEACANDNIQAAEENGEKDKTLLLEKVKRGLAGLFSVLMNNDWTLLCKQSWAIVFETLMGYSHGSSTGLRVWAINYVQTQVANGSLPRRLRICLLRCMTLRLILSFTTTSSEIPRGCDGVVSLNGSYGFPDGMEHLPGLLLDLLHSCACDGDHSSIRVLTSINNEAIKCFETSGPTQSLHDVAMNSLMSHDVGVERLCHVSLGCLFLLCIGNTATDHPKLAEAPFQDLIEALVVEDLEDQPPGKTPIQLEHAFVERSRENFFYESDLDDLCSQATDCVVDFLFSARWTSLRPARQSDAIIRALAPALAMQKLASRNHAASNYRHRAVDTYLDVLSYALPSIDHITQQDCSLGDIDTTLSVVLHSCEQIKSTVRGGGDVGRKRIKCFKMLQSLYFGLCEESNTCRLITRLEKQVLQRKRVKYEHTRQLFCLNTVKDEDDIDEFIHFLRGSVLQALTSTIQAPTGREAASSSTSAPSVSLVSVGNILTSCCNDLVTGLDGKSGGIPYDLFGTYLELLAVLIGLISKAADSHDTGCNESSVTLDVKRLCGLLEGILCSTVFRQKSAFEHLAVLTGVSLPRLYRCTLKARLFDDAPSITVEPEFEPETPFAVAGFEQAINSAKVFWESTLPLSSEDIESLDDCSTCSGKPREYCSKMPTPKFEAPAQPTAGTLGTVQIPDGRTWRWVMTTCASLFLQYLEDCRGLVRRSTEHVRFADDRTMRHYVATRTEESFKVFEVLCRVFEPVPDVNIRQDKASAANEEMAVGRFPLSVKRALSLVVERAVMVLTLAISEAHGCLKATSQAEDPPTPSLAQLEAIGLLSAWLSACPPESSIDWMHQCRKWHCWERVRQRNDNHQEVLSMKRIQRVEAKLRVFDKALDRLSLALSDRKRCEFWQGLCSAVADDNLVPVLVTKSQNLRVQWRELDRATHKKNDQQRQQTKNMERRLRRDRRRPTIRSRNVVVDDWLQRDRVTGEEQVEEDAYADLEDFLVEG